MRDNYIDFFQRIIQLSNSLLKILFPLLILIIPLNLFLTFPVGVEYLNGLRIDYLIPKLYLAEVIAIFIIFTYLIGKLATNSLQKKIADYKQILFLVLLISILLLSQLLSFVPLIGLIAIIKLLLAIILSSIILKKNKSDTFNLLMSLSLGISILLQFSIVCYQWWFQNSLFPYYIFGEPQMSWSLFMAKSTWTVTEKILPYGTTAHPNVAAGFMVIYFFLLVEWSRNIANRKFNFQNLKKYVMIVIFLMVFSITFLTESVSAIFALSIGLIILFINVFKHQNIQLDMKKWHLLMIIFTYISSVLIIYYGQYSSDDTFFRRSVLLQASLNLIKTNPIIGVGAQQFTIALNQSDFSQQLAPFIQPVHSVFWLMVTELGLIGLVVLIEFSKKIKSSWASSKLPILLFFIAPLIIFDHYLYSLGSGLLLLFLTPLLFKRFVTQ